MIQARTVADDSPAGYFGNLEFDRSSQTQCDNFVRVHTYYPYGCVYICIYYIYRQLQLIQIMMIRLLCP